MQINGFFQIVTDVTSLSPTFFSCIALLDLLVLLGFTVTFALFVRMRRGFRSCGSDHGLCPLDSHKPLKRLDRNFKCFCAVSFVWLIGFCAVLAARLLSLEFPLIWTRLNKKTKSCRNLFCDSFDSLASFLFCYFRSADRSDIEAMTASFSENCFLCPDKFVEHIIRYECLDSSRKSAAVYS